jgi:hypothetical protein
MSLLLQGGLLIAATIMTANADVAMNSAHNLPIHLAFNRRLTLRKQALIENGGN